MATLEAWLEANGGRVAALLEDQRDLICDLVSNRLSTAFPSLCYDPARPDAVAFQRLTFIETPRRFHRLMQVVLRFQTLMVIDREYRWGWPIMQRFGVSRHHILSHVRWYFDVVRTSSTLDTADLPYIEQLSSRVQQIVSLATATLPQAVAQPETPALTNGHAKGTLPRS
jgi:hypothetical protein